MAIINMHDAKTQLSDLVARAEAGEEIFIARRNKPAVRLVVIGGRGDLAPPVELKAWENAPDDYIQKDDIAAYYRRFPQEWEDMVERVGFGETEQGFDMKGLREAIEAGREFTVMQEGKAVAKVAPVKVDTTAEAMGFGMFAHLRDKLPQNLFVEPMTQDEAEAWTKGDLP